MMSAGDILNKDHYSHAQLHLHYTGRIRLPAVDMGDVL